MFHLCALTLLPTVDGGGGGGDRKRANEANVSLCVCTSSSDTCLVGVGVALADGRIAAARGSSSRGAPNHLTAGDGRNKASSAASAATSASTAVVVGAATAGTVMFMLLTALVVVLIVQWQRRRPHEGVQLSAMQPLPSMASSLPTPVAPDVLACGSSSQRVSASSTTLADSVFSSPTYATIVPTGGTRVSFATTTTTTTSSSTVGAHLGSPVGGGLPTTRTIGSTTSAWHYSSPHDVRVEPSFEHYHMGAAEFDAVNRDMVSARMESQSYYTSTTQQTSYYSDPKKLVAHQQAYDPSQCISDSSRFGGTPPTYMRAHYADPTKVNSNPAYDKSHWISEVGLPPS